MSKCTYFVAQSLRFAPFKSLSVWNKGLSLCDRFLPPVSKEKPFRAGNGYYLCSRTTNPYYIAGTHEWALLSLIHDLLHEGDYLVDVGANAGTSILWLHHQSPRKALSFFAIEAMPDNVAILKENLALNPDVQCEIIEAAMGAEDDVSISFGTAGPGDGSARAGSLISDDQWSNRERIEVASSRLDTQLSAIEKVPNCILIDVEGFAGEVLKGASTVLQNAKPIVVVELHSDDEQRSVESELNRFGYSATYTTSRYGLHKIYEATRTARLL